MRDDLCLFSAGEFSSVSVVDPDLAIFTAGEFGCDELEVVGQRNFILKTGTVQQSKLGIATVQQKALSIATVQQAKLDVATTVVRKLNG